MHRSNAPSAPDIIFLLCAPIFAIGGAVRLTQSDGDLAAHLRMGDFILENRHIPAHSLGSYTAAADRLVLPGWLSEIIFVLLDRAGGLPLIAVVAGLIVAVTHSAIAVFLRARGVDARATLVAALGTLILGASHWLARPHMFSILAAAITIFLLESRVRARAGWFFALFVLWANLHGGWLYGLIMIGAYVAGAVAESILGDRDKWLERARSHGIALLAASLATVVNPYMLELHREVIGGVTSASLAKYIDEYQPPDFGELESLPFLLAIFICAGLMLLVRRRPPLTWLAVMCISLVFGLRASRNVALFGVTAVPLVALHVSRSWNTRRPFGLFGEFAELDKRARVGMWAAAMVVLLLGLGLNRGTVAGTTLIENRFDPSVFPVVATERAMASGLNGRIFHPWLWGGYLLYAWPGSSLHVDPLEFSQETIDSHTKIESMKPGWREELMRWDISLVMVEADEQLASALASEPGWTVWHRDSTAVILQRISPPA